MIQNHYTLAGLSLIPAYFSGSLHLPILKQKQYLLSIINSSASCLLFKALVLFAFLLKAFFDIFHQN